MRGLLGINFSRPVKLGRGGDNVVALQPILGISIATADIDVEKWTKNRVQANISEGWKVLIN